MENEQNQSANAGARKKSSEGALQLLQPHDMSKTVESAMHVFQGRHEKLPELLHDVGTLVLKATKKLTTTQLILSAGAVTIGAILVARYVGDQDFDFDSE
ncbi:hypothetical protein FVR03_09150 [Pontibacter qinzhouensis]|uniref:Uncharacterized protein n=1 Tax=Pontibacter qinzhouensis TaxID=2603253 RepID=A0A5C8KBV3_9BACT|nr:hypothetical protein [Pontibacter qinzhouensis]TXK47549.1 hypothetical protein FVR03_09150 [Pontibacter qinzhouensis]